MHYKDNALVPFKSFDTKAISLSLENLGFSETQITTYINLLKKHLGILSFEDLYAFANSLYRKDPMSLVGRTIELPEVYYPLQGVYRNAGDLEEVVAILQAIKEAEGFKYRLLVVKKNVTLDAEPGKVFSTNLIYEVKAVSLNGPIHCRFKEPPLPHAQTEDLFLNENCILLGSLKQEGTRQLALIMENRVNSSEEISILINIQTKSIPRVLLGRKEIFYTMQTKNPSLDLVELCRAVALPVGSSLQCNLDSNDQESRLSLSNCQLQLNFESNFSDLTTGVIFSNQHARKTCILHFSTSNELDLTQLSQTNSTDQSLPEQHYYFGHNNFEKPNNSVSVSKDFPRSRLQLVQSYGYITLIPLLQGVFEGLVDTRISNTYAQSSLKLISRLILMPFSVASFIGFVVMSLASGLEALIKANKSSNKYIGNLIPVAILIALVELEYGIFDLWESVSKSGDCSTLIEVMNKIFINHAFSPAIKACAYEIIKELSLKHVSKPSTPNENKKVGNTHPLLNPNETIEAPQEPLSFLTASKKAANTVLSSKLKLTFFSSFFKDKVPKPKEGILLSGSMPN